MKVRLLTTLLALVAVAAVVAAPAGSRLTAAAPRAVNIVACKQIVTKPKWKCNGPFTLGIPSSTPTVMFWVSTTGDWGPKGGRFSMEILDQTKQPLTSPFETRLSDAYKTGFWWWFQMSGPFPKLTVYMQPKLNGKPVGPAKIFRFI